MSVKTKFQRTKIWSLSSSLTKRQPNLIPKQVYIDNFSKTQSKLKCKINEIMKCSVAHRYIKQYDENRK